MQTSEMGRKLVSIYNSEPCTAKDLEKYEISSGIYFLGRKEKTTWRPRKIRLA
jgi:hypothetical protein